MFVKLVVSIEKTTMGTTSSRKTDNTGEIVNNVTIQDIVKVENTTIIILLVAILSVLVFNTIYKIYINHRRGLRKRYLSSPARVAVVDSNAV